MIVTAKTPTDLMMSVRRYFFLRRGLFALVLLAVALRLAALAYVEYRAYPYPFPLLEFDARQYHRIGVNLAAGGSFSEGAAAGFAPDSFRTPIYPFLIAVFLFLFRSITPILIFQAALAGCTVVAVYELARRLVPHAPAITAATFAALDPFSVVYSNILMTEPFFLFLLTVALLLFTKEEMRAGEMICVGILLGVAALTRPIGVFLPFLLAFLFVVFKKKFVLPFFLLAAFVSVVFPWLLRNKLMFDTWSLSSVGSYNLYYYNALRFYQKEHSLGEEEARKIFDERLIARYGEGGVERSLFNAPIQRREGLAIIAAHPVRYAFFHLGTLLPFFLSDGIREATDLLGWTERSYLDFRGAFLSGDFRAAGRMLSQMGFSGVLFIAGALFWTLLMFFWLAGACLARRKAFTALTLFFSGALFAILSGVVTTVRFRYAVSSIFFVVAVYGCYEALHYYSRLQRARHNPARP